jgi:two-component system, OmpR family, response regulator
MGRVVSRDELREEVWGYGYDSGSTVVETFMSSLRKKVDRGPAPLIRTVRGFGYRLVPPGTT